MKALFWYELIRRSHTHVALGRPRAVGELVRLRDADGFIIQNGDGKWTAYAAGGRAIDSFLDVSAAKRAVELSL